MSHLFKPGKQQVLVEVITLLIVVVLLYAAINKLIHYRAFRFVLGITPTLKGMVSILTFAIPILELLIAILMLIQKTKIAGLYLSIGLFIIYLVGMFQLKLYVPNIRGGILDRLSFTQYLILNTLLLTLAIFGIVIHYWSKRLANEEPEPPAIIFT